MIIAGVGCVKGWMIIQGGTCEGVHDHSWGGTCEGVDGQSRDNLRKGEWKVHSHTAWRVESEEQEQCEQFAVPVRCTVEESESKKQVHNSTPCFTCS